jgi:septal ring-binding cell division protein DamX
MQTPPEIPAGPPERRCPRCGAAMAPDQEWCLACGAAAGTEVVEAEGWRIPLYLGGGLVALAIIGVILAIVALSNQKQEANATPTPTAVASVPPGATISPLPSPTTAPVTPVPTTDDGTGTAAPTETPTATATEAPTDTPTPDAGSGTFPGWTGSDGDYTIIIKSATSQSSAEKTAQKAQDAGTTVGILNSDDYSSLNGGYYVVFSGDYATKSDAQADLDGIRADFKDAYVRQIKS